MPDGQGCVNQRMMRRCTLLRVKYTFVMVTLMSAAAALVLAGAATERPALVIAGAEAPARIDRATVLTPADGPPVILYSVTSIVDQPLDTFTVMAFVFKPDGTPKARQVAPGRRTLDPHETKYSSIVLDGTAVEASDIVVIGINQAQRVGSDAWWRADLRPLAEAAVPLKKP
jgi:hypothetical protein